MSHYTIKPERGGFRVFDDRTRTLTNGRFHRLAQAEQWISMTEDTESRRGREKGPRCASPDYAGDNERIIRRVGGGL